MKLDTEDITAGISFNIYKSIEKSLENNSKETFEVLDSFVWKIIHLSFSKRSLNHFQQYIAIPVSYYRLSFEKKNTNSSLETIYKYCSRSAIDSLKYIIENEIDTQFNIRKIANEEINIYYYWAFNSYSQLLFWMVKNGDLQQFKLAIESFSQISDPYYDSHYELRDQILDLQRSNINGIHNNRIREIKERYLVACKFQTYYRHTLLGIKYWIMYLFQISEIIDETAIAFINLINVQYHFSEDTLNDILFFRSNKAQWYMNWGNWDYTERNSGIAYFPPNPYEWLTFGFMLDQIRGDLLPLNIDEFIPEDSSGAKFLFSEFQKAIAVIETDSKKWFKILKINSEDDLQIKFTQIKSFYSALKQETIGIEERAIVAAPLSENRVSKFKRTACQAWKKGARVSLLFKKFGRINEITDEGENLKEIGRNFFFERGKAVFIDGDHSQDFSGFSGFAERIGRFEDDEFFRTIISDECNKIYDNNSLTLIINAIKEIKKNGFSPDLIITAPLTRINDRDLLDDDLFIKFHHLKDYKEDFLSSFYLGSYDEIKIYYSSSEYIKNRILVCDIKHSFEMKYKTNPEWVDNELTVNVNLVSDKAAQQRLTLEPDKWLHREDGEEIGEEDALTLIKTSVIIEQWSTLEFNVLNQDAYIIGNIKTENK